MGLRDLDHVRVLEEDGLSVILLRTPYNDSQIDLLS